MEQRKRTTSDARADRVVQELTGFSRAGVRGLFDHGCVSVNDKSCSTPQILVRTGDVVSVRYDPQRNYKERAKVKSDPAFELLYEDEHVLVVNKSPHVYTVATATDKGRTLVEALERHVNRQRPSRSKSRPNAPGRLTVVQRLDRGVSGVVVVAKSAKAAGALREQFASRKPQRIYIAIVSGHLEPRKGTFRSRMATGRTLNRYSTNQPGAGELAITHYEVLDTQAGDARRHRQGASPNATPVRVQLETGRRNQIRVHFAEAGHPVLGDRRYRPDLSVHPKWKARRIALHAWSLEFKHPETGKVMRFEAALPREFEPWIP